MADLAKCGVCEALMDVSAAPPYARVKCPTCEREVRVNCDFGPYFLERRHAFGGMSVVFVAVDTALGREVALKVLNEEYSADEYRAAKFEKEAELTALVSHPNVVRVYTVGRAHGRFYIAMELVQGESLEKRMESGKPLPEGEMLEIALQVVEGLQAAKESGLIHRDIKPGNILVDEKGTVKIVDFGLSLVTQGGQAKADEVFATPYYVSPEALESVEEDFRSDMYALGASLYHALAGKPPVATQSTGTKVLWEAKQKVLPLSKMAPWLMEATGQVVDRAMAFQRDERFGSYEEMRKALKEALAGASGERPRPLTDLRQRRRKKGAGVAMVLAVIGGVSAILLMLFLKREEPLESEVAVAPAPLEPQLSEEVLIGRLYQDARNRVKKGDFRSAELAFGELWRREGVPEPTSSWACFEAGVAAALDGRSADARGHFERLRRHVGESEMDSSMREQFEVLCEDWKSLPFIKLPPDAPAAQNEALFYFARALKNWEQGDGAAVHAFRALSQGDEENEDKSSLSIYREWARKMVADFSLLESEEPDWGQDWSEELIQSEVQRLEELVKKLQTGGRARFKVRSWQEWLHGRAKEFEQQRDAGV